MSEPLATAEGEMPDLIKHDLDILFVNINPAVVSARRGRYFATPTNRFWPSFSRSKLSKPARNSLVVEQLGPEHDRRLLDYGIGFTDLVKRATPRASDLASSELHKGVEQLVIKVSRYRPRIACFHGVTSFRPVHRVLTGAQTRLHLGPQDPKLGSTRLFLVPNPSGANRHYTPRDQILWYDNLAEFLNGITRSHEP